MGDQQGIGAAVVEVVVGHVAGGVAAAAVVVVPVLAAHQHRYHQAERHGQRGGGHAVLLLGQFLEPGLQGQHAQADPQGEYIEGTRVRIVTLAYLERILVEVHHDGQAGEQEEQAGDPAVARVMTKLEEEADQAQDQRQEEIVVLPPVVDDEVGAFALVAQAQLVDELDAAFPIAAAQVAGCVAVDVVLPAHEIPHEIADVHVVDLVVEEETQVVGHRGLLEVDPPAVNHGAAGLVFGDIALVEGFVFFLEGIPHAREKHLRAGGEGGVHVRGVVVFTIERRIIGFFLDLIGRVEGLPVEDRRGAVLFAAQVADQGIGIVGLVLVHRRSGAGTDDGYGKERVADHDGGDHQGDGVGHGFVFPAEGPQQEEAGGHEEHHEDRGADIELGAESIDEEAVHAGGQARQVGNDAEEHDGQDHARQREDAEQMPEGDGLLVLLIIDKEYDGRDGQQVEQVDTDGQAHQEADEDEPAVGIRRIGLFFPFERRPEDHGGEERRHRIDFPFYGREPERIGKTVGESAHDPCAEERDGTGFGERPSPLLLEPASEVDDGQVEEEDGQAGAEGAHRIDGDGGVGGSGDNGEDAGEQVEDHVAGGVSDFQLVGRGDEFTAVPETGGGLDGEQIDQRGKYGYGQRDDPVDPVELFFIHKQVIFRANNKDKGFITNFAKILQGRCHKTGKIS